MAIDSATKRLSALRVANPMARTLPIPDGTIAAADRVHLLGGYGGLFDSGSAFVAIIQMPPYVADAITPITVADRQ